MSATITKNKSGLKRQVGKLFFPELVSRMFSSTFVSHTGLWSGFKKVGKLTYTLGMVEVQKQTAWQGPCNGFQFMGPKCLNI